VIPFHLLHPDEALEYSVALMEYCRRLGGYNDQQIMEALLMGRAGKMC
jgi:hypothetical protein